MRFAIVLSTEFLKLRRTKVLPVLSLLYMIGPAVLCLMMAALRDPVLGERLGLLTTKAELTIGAVDWSTYLTFVGFFFMGGIVIIGIAQAYVFGREYLEGTAKNLLTLPTHRMQFILAKLMVSGVWFTTLAIVLAIESVLLGLAIDLGELDRDIFLQAWGRVSLITFQVICVSSIPAWIAIATRGYIAPLGLSVLFLLIADLFAHTLLGPWIPWSIIMLTTGAIFPGDPIPGLSSQLVLLVTFVLGVVAAWLTLDRKDNTQ